uniref:Dephospho-CoA kinase n=1 Tax=Caldimicrobium thiodismutans TaxID=1653476 RepID=A0A832GLP9_9BACT
MKTKLIAITGGLATGKSTFLRLLQKMGFTTLSCDEIVKDLYKSDIIKKKVVNLLGEDILSEDWQIDKRKVLEKILQNPSLRRALESLIHPLVWEKIKETLRECTQKGNKIIFVEVPLLFEAGWETFFDEIWVITCKEETQKWRIEEKPDKELWLKLSQMQLPLEIKERRANRLFSSEKSPSEWERELREILKEYLKE